MFAIGSCQLKAASVEETKLFVSLQSSQANADKLSALLSLSRYYVNKPGNHKEDMDKASQYASQSVQLAKSQNNKTGLAAAYLVSAQIRRESGEKISARNFAAEAIRIYSDNPKYITEQANAIFELSDTYGLDNENDFSNKITWYRKGVGLLKKSMPNSLKLANALRFLGDLEGLNDNARTALKYLKESLAIYQSCKYKQLQELYSLMGTASLDLGDVQAALSYLLLARDIAYKYRDTSATLSTIYNRIGAAYNETGLYEKSVLAFRKALEIAQHNHDRDAILVISTNLSRAYNQLLKPKLAIAAVNDQLKYTVSTDSATLISLHSTLIDAYLKLNEPRLALRSYKKIVKLVKHYYLYSYQQANFHKGSARLFFKLKDYGQMAFHIMMLREVERKIKNPINMRDLEYLSFRLDSVRGNAWKAMEHFKQYKAFSDSVQRKNYNKSFTRIQAEFDSKAKDQEISEKARHIRLLNQQKDLQKRTLASELVARKLLVAGVVLLIFLLVLANSRYRIKRKAHLDLKEKQAAINEQNQSLKELLTDREYLIKEIHHRVKNNLQIIISLLDSQSSFLTDDLALDVIRESQHRIASISMVHQQLYQEGNLSGIEISTYISELIAYMKQSFDIASNIRFDMNIAPLILDVSQSVPLGLILSEIITNAIKYAFHGAGSWVIRIDLSVISNCIELVISDNGCGLPEGFNPLKCSSLGMNLIHGLTKQLKGEVQFLNSKGVSIRIKIPKQTSSQHRLYPVAVEKI
jgi:two-component sensor histidine kinase